MKLPFSSLGFLFVVLFLGIWNTQVNAQQQSLQQPMDPQALAQRNARLDFCKTAANAMLKQRSAMSNNQFSVQCYCYVPNDKITNFVNWCYNYASDSDMDHLKNSITQSSCAQPDNAPNCIQP